MTSCSLIPIVGAKRPNRHRFSFSLYKEDFPQIKNKGNLHVFYCPSGLSIVLCRIAGERRRGGDGGGYDEPRGGAGGGARGRGGGANHLRLASFKSGNDCPNCGTTTLSVSLKINDEAK